MKWAGEGGSAAGDDLLSWVGDTWGYGIALLLESPFHPIGFWQLSCSRACTLMEQKHLEERGNVFRFFKKGGKVSSLVPCKCELIPAGMGAWRGKVFFIQGMIFKKVSSFQLGCLGLTAQLLFMDLSPKREKKKKVHCLSLDQITVWYPAFTLCVPINGSR